MAKNLRVAYVLKQYPRLSETFILNELLALEAEGVEVSVYSLRHATEGRFHPALSQFQGTVTYAPEFGRLEAYDAFAALAEIGAGRLHDALTFLELVRPEHRSELLIQSLELARLVRRTAVDHVHAHFLTVASHIAYLVHLFTGVPYTVTAHAKDIYRYTVDWEVARRVSGAARAVVTVCDANLQHLETRLGESAARVTRIYNGLGPQEPPAPLEARDRFTVLAVGRLVEKKGFHVLLDAVSALRQQYPHLRCVVVGDGEERAALEAQALALGLGATVHFTGAVLQHEVARWLRRAHVLAAPCLVGEDGNQDALPTVLLEALAAGLPSVTTPIAGIPEIIDHDVHGLIVPPGDASALASALSRLLSDDAQWRRMSSAGPERLSSRFDRRETIRSLIELFASSPVRSR